MVDEIKVAENVKTIHITTDPWVDTSYLSKLYSDPGGDRFQDALSDMKAVSTLLEDPDDVAAALFQACPALTKVGLVGRYDTATKYTAERDECGKLLQVSDGEFTEYDDPYYCYSPLTDELEWWDRRWARL
jgi:hypothetical protein